jgi:hypothetical protein
MKPLGSRHVPVSHLVEGFHYGEVALDGERHCQVHRAHHGRLKIHVNQYIINKVYCYKETV